MARRRLFAVVLMTASLLLATIGVTSADLKTTNVLEAWDDAQQRWENGFLVINLDGNPEPFYTGLEWDTDQHPDACGVGVTTQYAGDALIGLYHTDNAPAGAPGFVSSQTWSLVPCSIFPATKYPTPLQTLATCDPATEACSIIGSPDVITACTTGNCTDEIVTMFHVNLDADCDGAIDPQFDIPGGVCMYWEGIKPPMSPEPWKGNIQVRFSGNSGEKTINFSVAGPNAVSLSSLGAVAEANSGSLAAFAGALLLAAAALFVWRWRRA